MPVCLACKGEKFELKWISESESLQKIPCQFCKGSGVTGYTKVKQLLKSFQDGKRVSGSYLWANQGQVQYFQDERVTVSRQKLVFHHLQLEGTPQEDYITGHGENEYEVVFFDYGTAIAIRMKVDPEKKR